MSRIVIPFVVPTKALRDPSPVLLDRRGAELNLGVAPELTKAARVARRPHY